MSFDTATRNRLSSFVAKCRQLLCGDYNSPGGDMAARLAHYGIQVSGNVAPLESLTHLDEPGLETARLLRDLLAHKRARSPEAKVWKAFDGAVYDLLQEQGFTALNRLCALRMAEERKLITQCVGKGQQSEGFELFEYHTGKTNEGCPVEVRYQQFLYAFFDELALDLGALFSRHSPQGLLFPSPQALQTLLGELNHPDLAALWAQDETIGWIYQYWNSKEERGAMREASAAPRNSRELAVRNQFFTPRYVVEFLTDNTLGRIWYEMTQGKTGLKEQCRYLVRRPSEVFLQAGETAPEQEIQDGLSQEELLRQTVYVPHRVLKDPREIRLLDPACGSMHFGLYAFDLFEVIYTEWWDNFATPVQREELLSACQLAEGAATQSISNPAEQRTYFQRHVPRLILENNIHGIDIDPRATQIAGLSLYFRAQRAWLTQKLSAQERPQIRRANIVCAEPMPGEKELLQEFVNKAFPLEERPIFLRMLEDIFDKMQLAGEAGSLLKIEEEIRSSVAEAKKRWKEGPKLEQSLLFTESAPGEKQKDLKLDLSGITDEQFWGRVEERIYAALRDYAEQAENGGGFQRRLFADDAARGFAFIDVCRKRYEAVVMNPPFGASTDSIKDLLAHSYFGGRTDLYACSILRALEIASSQGAIGAITARTGFFLQSFADWRTGLLGATGVCCFADLGGDVLDSAMVETAAYALHKGKLGIAPFFRIEGDDKADGVLGAINVLSKGLRCQTTYLQNPQDFSKVPDKAWAYWLPSNLAAVVGQHKSFDPHFGDIRLGVQTNDDFRFSRLWWEVPPDLIGDSARAVEHGKGWVTFLKGGDSTKYFADISMVLNWFGEGRELKELITIALDGGHWSRHIQSIECYFLPGVSWALRTDNFDPHLVPAGCISSVSRYFAIPRRVSIPTLLGVWNCRLFDFLAKLRMEKWQQPKFVIGVVKDLPFPCLLDGSQKLLEDSVLSIWRLKCGISRSDETSRYAVVPEFGVGQRIKVESRNNTIQGDTTAGLIVEFEKDVERIVTAEFGYSSAQLGAVFSGLTTVKLKVSDSQEKQVQGALGFFLGSAFGRWDIRYATGEQVAPELPDPFAPLPVCPPGQLQNAQGLPVCPEDVPAAYPVSIPWDGILVDDPNHPLDIKRRVREVIEIIWSGKEGGPTAEAIEHEACEILGVKSLRDYFRKPAGFFADHLKRYSKSRRKAPIYWPLSTPSGKYTIWLYYHRLNDGTLYKVVEQFVEPKQAEVQATYQTLAAKESRTRAEDKELEEAQTLMGELATFRDDLFRLAKIWKPNLNDGVVITAAPLWKHFRLPSWQKELRSTWDSLERGEYDWAHLAYSLWPERVTEKCKTDRSLAIAHGLEHLCTIDPPKPKKKKTKVKVEEEEEML